MSFILAKKWHSEYLEMIGLIFLFISLAVVIYNTLLIKGQRVNQGLHSQRPILGCGMGSVLAGYCRI